MVVNRSRLAAEGRNGQHVSDNWGCRQSAGSQQVVSRQSAYRQQVVSRQSAYRQQVVSIQTAGSKHIDSRQSAGSQLVVSRQSGCVQENRGKLFLSCFLNLVIIPTSPLCYCICLGSFDTLNTENPNIIFLIGGARINRYYVRKMCTIEFKIKLFLKLFHLERQPSPASASVSLRPPSVPTPGPTTTTTPSVASCLRIHLTQGLSSRNSYKRN